MSHIVHKLFFLILLGIFTAGFASKPSEGKVKETENSLLELKKYGAGIFKKTKSGKQQRVMTVDSFEMLPSWESCRSPQFHSEDTWTFVCSDCTLIFEIEIDDSTYVLHSDATHSGDYPKGSFTNATEGFGVSVADSFDLTYRAPENSGIYDIKTTWLRPGFPNLITWITAYVFVDNLENFDGNGYLNFDNITSHPGDGTYLTNSAGTALISAMSNYIVEAQSNGVPLVTIPTPKSEGASLAYGGIFDINRNWSTPHCNHRQGIEADIAMSTFSGHPYRTDLLNALVTALSNASFAFPVSYESPSNASATHWHVRF